MKCRGLTRVVALATVVSMMSVELSVSATSDINTGTAAEGTTDTTAESDGTEEATSTNAETTATDAGTSAGKEDNTTVGNERLEHNYAVVSKGYKYPVYTGSSILLKIPLTRKQVQHCWSLIRVRHMTMVKQ